MKGYLTIFFAMTMSLILSLTMGLIEGARYSALRLVITTVHQTAGNSILGQYHRQLFERYGVLFFEITELETKAVEFMNENFKTDVLGELLSVRDLLAIQTLSTQVEGMTLAIDGKGKVLRRQCVQCIEEKLGISYLQQIVQTLNIVEEQGFGKQESNLEIGSRRWTKRELEEQAQMSELEGTLLPSTLSWLQKEALKFLVDGKSYSTASLPNEERLSKRLAAMTEKDNTEFVDENTDWESLLFLEYLFTHTGNYRSPLDDGHLKYQMEYILNGKDSDETNLWETADKLLQFRTWINMVSILADEDRVALLKEVSTSLAAALGNTEIEPVIYGVLLLIWGEVEGVYDVKRLLAGESVCLLKAEEDWLVKSSWLLGFATPLSQMEGEWEEVQKEGNTLLPLLLEENEERKSCDETKQSKKEIDLYYADYLRILLWFLDKEEIALRFMDIVESDIRMVTGESGFCLEHYAERVWLKTKLSSDYSGEFWVQREYGY